MKHLFIESLREFELTPNEKVKIFAKNGELKHDTDGDEDCFILDPTTGLRKRKKNTLECM